jgi:hypothetical protein
VLHAFRVLLVLQTQVMHDYLALLLCYTCVLKEAGPELIEQYSVLCGQIDGARKQLRHKKEWWFKWLHAAFYTTLFPRASYVNLVLVNGFADIAAILKLEQT